MIRCAAGAETRKDGQTLLAALAFGNGLLELSPIVPRRVAHMGPSLPVRYVNGTDNFLFRKYQRRAPDHIVGYNIMRAREGG